MDQVLKPYDKEFMRRAMLKHEETFKEQVYELHRLYQIQKILMRKIERNRLHATTSPKLWKLKNEHSFQKSNRVNYGVQEKSTMKLDLEIPVEEHIAELNGNRVLDVLDESEIELTLSLVPTSSNRRRKNLETQLTSDSGTNFSSSSTGSGNTHRTSSSTHQITPRIKEETSRQELRFGRNIPDVSLGYHSGSKDSSEVIDEQLRKERLSQSPWLFQVLGLNMT